MSSFTKGAALTACGGLLIAGLTALPAQAAGSGSPALTTPSTSGLALAIDRVSTKATKTKITKKTVVLKYRTVKQKTKSLYKGDKKVIKKGRNGVAVRTYITTTVNGKVTTVVKRKVVRKAINRVVKIGTNGKHKINLARLAQWNKIAKCESGNRWHINTGNGYYGGLQFNLETWRSVKGQDFAKYPHRATKREQITVANRLYAKRGFQPWTCRRVL